MTIAKRRIAASIWNMAPIAVVGALLSLSFCMLVKGQVLDGLAATLGVPRSALNVAADVFGVAGLVVGITSVAASIIGNMMGKR